MAGGQVTASPWHSPSLRQTSPWCRAAVVAGEPVLGRPPGSQVPLSAVAGACLPARGGRRTAHASARAHAARCSCRRWCTCCRRRRRVPLGLAMPTLALPVGGVAAAGGLADVAAGAGLGRSRQTRPAGSGPRCSGCRPRRAVPSGLLARAHMPVAASHMPASWQAPAGAGDGVRCPRTPPQALVRPGARLPSLQLVPSARWLGWRTCPVAGSQAGPGTRRPPGRLTARPPAAPVWQVSAAVHWLVSSQVAAVRLGGVGAGAGRRVAGARRRGTGGRVQATGCARCRSSPEQASFRVQGLPSLQRRGRCARRRCRRRPRPPRAAQAWQSFWLLPPQA